MKQILFVALCCVLLCRASGAGTYAETGHQSAEVVTRKLYCGMTVSEVSKTLGGGALSWFSCGQEDVRFERYRRTWLYFSQGALMGYLDITEMAKVRYPCAQSIGYYKLCE
jgi:hypothetical protein